GAHDIAPRATSPTEPSKPRRSLVFMAFPVKPLWGFQRRCAEREQRERGEPVLAGVVPAHDMRRPRLPMFLGDFFKAEVREAPGAGKAQPVEVALLRVGVI